LRDILVVADEAHRLSHGCVDPTVLTALEAQGYDRDFDQLACDTRPAVSSAPVSWSDLEFNAEAGTLRRARGVRLDLGAVAKAWTADRAVEILSSRGGVLVEIGGDVAVAGQGPEGAWVVGVQESLERIEEGPRLALHGGALATSSTTARRCDDHRR
jgi:thiamine biosynthesis lipoprotein